MGNKRLKSGIPEQKPDVVAIQKSNLRLIESQAKASSFIHLMKIETSADSIFAAKNTACCAGRAPGEGRRTLVILTGVSD